MRDKITNILEHWFLQEPPLFQVMCLHSVHENRNMNCPFRCGQGRIEYNPDYLENLSDAAIEDLLKVEAIRILLMHPYDRKPDGCSQASMGLASNITVGDNYNRLRINIETPKDFQMEKGKPYEFYARQLTSMEMSGGQGTEYSDKAAGGVGQSGGNAQSGGEDSPSADRESNRQKFEDLAGLWEEDPMFLIQIGDVIDKTQDWGSLGGKFAEKIKASTKAKIDWRKVMAGFRASILSSKRQLTRMKPNRRTGFQNMGSVRKFTTRLLVAVDTSGSISSKALSYFFGVINSAFRYGFETIDVIQFDCGVRAEAKSLKKAMQNVIAVGRGGTSFQEPVDFAIEGKYDGLVMLTDGFAEQPKIPPCTPLKIIWVCDCQASYEINREWMSKLGRVCKIDLA